ncbi:MAG: response regulator transcription factor, partial [Acetobacteraceae bacterium]
LRLHPGLRLTEEVSQAEVVVSDARPAVIGSRPASDTGAAEPTPREREVLELLALGASNKMIARRLGISLGTTKFHVAALLLKLGARSRSDVIAIAVRRGLLLL